MPSPWRSQPPPGGRAALVLGLRRLLVAVDECLKLGVRHAAELVNIARRDLFHIEAYELAAQLLGPGHSRAIASASLETSSEPVSPFPTLVWMATPALKSAAFSATLRSITTFSLPRFVCGHFSLLD